jgi:hypothetical protein
MSDMGYAFCSVAILSMWALTISAIKMSAAPQFDKSRIWPTPILVLATVAFAYGACTAMAIVEMEYASDLPDFSQRRIYKAYILIIALLSTVITIGFLINGLQVRYSAFKPPHQCHTIAAQVPARVELLRYVIGCDYCNERELHFRLLPVEKKATERREQSYPYEDKVLHHTTICQYMK